MTWMRMPGQTWLEVAASFLTMWVLMMMAMMLPSLVLTLSRYREAVRPSDEGLLGWLTLSTGLGYFSFWTLLGLPAFAVGVALAKIEMQQPALSRAVPVAVGVVVLTAGVLQLTSWKAHQLACCRKKLPCIPALRPSPARAWRHGLQIGLQCFRCCGNLMVISLVVGVMDLRAMALVAAAITAERLAPVGERVACAIGVVVAGAGLCLIARAMGLA